MALNGNNLKTISELEKQIFLLLPLNKLPLNSKSPNIKYAIQKVKNELKKRRLKFSPNFWISTEWFCPDGVCGVAIPFYLFNDDLLKLEKEKTGFVEGENTSQILKLIRHEVGHAFENLYGTRNHPLRIKLFGSSKEKVYPNSYSPRYFARGFAKHLGEGYAQAHPDEDFAETFAVWLVTPKYKWKKKYKNNKAFLNKILGLDKLIKSCASNPPLKSCSFKPYDEITENSASLASYYNQKNKKNKNQIYKETKKILKQIPRSQYNNKFNGINSVSFKQNFNYRNEISKNLGLYKYKTQKILKPAEVYLNNEYKVFSFSKKEQMTILDALTYEALESLRNRKDRVYL
jgi:hypothetical protein